MSEVRSPARPGSGPGSSSGGRRQGADLATPRDFLRVHALPTMARLADGDRCPDLWKKVDLTRPVLLYREYQAVKIHARSLRRTETGVREPIGPAIVIPEGYRGWFSLVREDGSSAPYYSSIEEVAAARLTLFLSRHDVPAYVMSENDLGGTVYKKVVVGAGNVLRLMGVFRDLNSAPGQSLSVNYAQCVNHKNEVLFLPFTAEGRFYAAATRSSCSPDHVFLMTQLLRHHRPPITVKLVCGFMPRMPCNFTGVLRLDQVRAEHLILGCTTDPEAPGTLFELNADSSLRLHRVELVDHHLSPAFTKALVMCERHGDVWRHQMKVSHDVFESSSSAGCRLKKTPSLSDRFSRQAAPASPQPAAVLPPIPAAVLPPITAQPPEQPAIEKPEPGKKKPLVKSASFDSDRRPARTFRQTVSKFFLNRSRGNRDVPTSFVFSRPSEVPYGRVADDISATTTSLPKPLSDENVYAEISEKDAEGRTVALRAANDYTMRLGSDGQSSGPSSPGDTMEHSTC